MWWDGDYVCPWFNNSFIKGKDLTFFLSLFFTRIEKSPLTIA